MSHTVFICHDYMLVEVLDQIQARLERNGIEVLRGPQTAPGKKLVYSKESYTELFGRAEVMMFSSRSICSREIMLAAPRLRGIVNPTIGLETVDLAAANELGIIVGHGATPENFLGMAEATVMLILMLMYQPRETEAVLRDRRRRPRSTPKDVWARMLRGRTVGLVGLGRIARGVVERLSGFGVSLVACDPFVGRDQAPEGVKMTDLDTLLRSSDIVAMLVSITPESRGMLGERELALMKPSAYLVNTSRGEAIDEAALYRALKEKRIAGAALDSFAVEPLPDDSPLRQLDNVILTPHMVGHTQDAFVSFPPAAVENITRILRGEPPLYCKNPEVIPAWQRRLANLGT
ncbi:MAG: dehydrogenase [Betaproteobacteria bacterium]|nr:MAG: dehydrogenase [Betaproteobacteria bacterium]